ncbi:ATP-binding cassette domain-containing protein [Bradyrhizobium sp. CSA207]|uniref:ABC transporter ATP-binding protein n=1 Tax=Bradyrhizobium sp. CSA207 TaxID=2698826 RepID=UPI0023B1E43F|nr:ABC transporter ATP-binding protein [Bradyrhizobium sp. CSA207]MDE5439975.1 ATP-binding cassette domain-containing protein [Bradyrhizobium sp. CSA207]
MPLVTVSDLTKTYVVGETAVPALRGVSLAIDSGEFVAIMGSSGSGKSTLMNLLGCLDTPSSGTYHLAGRDVLRLSSNKLAELRNTSIGFVFQQFNLLARATALENVELPMIYAGLWRRERKRRARKAMAEVGLSEREHHRPSQLSGGQQQRVAIARALVNQPLLLLADEPTGALDSVTSEEIMAGLVRLNEGGLTVIVVTHDAEVARYARRIIHFKDGRVISDDLNQGMQAAA